MTKIKATDTVYEITKAHPEVMEIMEGLGFHHILRPGLVHTTGRDVSLEKGAKLRNIDWEKLKAAFAEKGFEIE